MTIHRPELDGLRGLAAYIVVVSHASNMSGLWGNLLGEGAGQIGVMLFFVLSGYLIGSIYLPRRLTGQNILDYARHRIARVLPLFYFVVTSALVLGSIGTIVGGDFSIYPIDLNNAIEHYLLLRGVSSLWTIPVEIQFYVIFIGLWWLVTKLKPLVWTVIAAACIVLYAGSLAGMFEPPPFAFYASFFLVGILVSMANWKTPAHRHVVLWSIALAVALAALLCLFPNVGKFIGVSFAQRWQQPAYLVVVTTVFVSSLHAPLARTLFANTVMIFSGKVSYSIYLLHLPVLVYLDRFYGAPKWPLTFAITGMAITILMATMSYHLIESPARTLINGLFSDRAPRESGNLVS